MSRKRISRKKKGKGPGSSEEELGVPARTPSPILLGDSGGAGGNRFI